MTIADCTQSEQSTTIEKPEEWLTLAQAAAILPFRPSIPTVWRWARKGLKGTKLEYLRVGARIIVSREAIRRFGEALAARDADPMAEATQKPVTRTPAQRAAVVAAAKAKFATASVDR